jgi:hypothetical protein
VVAKGEERANRDEDMAYFAAYYKENFIGIQFRAFKKAREHPELI